MERPKASIVMLAAPEVLLNCQSIGSMLGQTSRYAPEPVSLLPSIIPSSAPSIANSSDRGRIGAITINNTRDLAVSVFL